MDNTWKRTYDALGQLAREIRERSPEAGAQHFSEKKRIEICTAIQRVREDATSCHRLGKLLEKYFA